MAESKTISISVLTQEDVVSVRQAVRKLVTELSFNLVDQTKVVTAASELARNTFIYGGGGTVTLEPLRVANRNGVRLVFEDKGPGIPNVEEALRDGFTTGNGLGLGLGGAKRLSSEFAIESQVGAWTRIVFVRWKH